jgi:hypothetical protein
MINFIFVASLSTAIMPRPSWVDRKITKSIGGLQSMGRLNFLKANFLKAAQVVMPGLLYFILMLQCTLAIHQKDYLLSMEIR